MEIYEKKTDALYRNENGDKIMVRISLPRSDSESELDLLYSTLSSSYVKGAVRFIDSIKGSDKKCYFLSVGYEAETLGDRLKIKRFARLRVGNMPIKEHVMTDVFDTGTFKLKK